MVERADGRGGGLEVDGLVRALAEACRALERLSAVRPARLYRDGSSC